MPDHIPALQARYVVRRRDPKDAAPVAPTG
jgi:hypothetical protein